MAAVQLNFTLRTSSSCKTVHLRGSWDNYSGKFPLSKDPSKSGGWKGTFRFQGTTLKPGQRYWYYYIIDGFHVSHDPARESVTEPTTGRKLNILDIPSAKPTAKPPDTSQSKSKRNSTSGHSRRNSQYVVAQGRSLSPSKIQSPLPTNPHATHKVIHEKFSKRQVEELSAQFAAADISESEDTSESESDDGSDVPSLTSSRSSNNSSPSSVSSTSSCCTCERYGITRAGDRVKLDCGGQRCGYSDSSECGSSSEDEHYATQTRRNGIVIRK